MVEIRKLLSILKIVLPLIIFALSVWGIIFSFWVYEESADSSVSQFFVFGLGMLLSGIIIYFQLLKEKDK